MRHLLSHRPLRRLGTVFATVAVVVPLVGSLTHPAGADQIADKRAQAERIAKQLDAQGERISVLDERLNQAQIAADRVTGQAQAARAALATVDARVRAARSALTTQAVASYIRGGSLPDVQAMASGQQSDLGLRNAYMKTITGREQSALDALHGAKEELAATQASLNDAQRSARAALASVDAERRAAAAAEAGQQRLLAQVNGDLAGLVAAEQQRRSAEAAARAQAELAARANQPAPASRSNGAHPRPATPSGPEPPVSKDASGAVEEARRQLGKPYSYGAAGPNSFDCSGLTMWSWAHAGHSLPHSAAAQYNATTRVAIADLQPGDLVFFGSDIHHEGIYVGGGQMIEAPHSGTNVRYASIYRSDLMGAGRVG